MLTALRRHTGVSALAALATAAVGCRDTLTTGSSVAITPIGNAASYGTWHAGPHDTCPDSVHNRYSVVGPDHKLYPTWHPPVDPVTGCTFGHDHGRDPHGSNLYSSVGDIPFGYANEQLDTWDPANPRHEDHFGHKIEWANDVPLHFNSNAANALFDVHCDVLAKLHQGTHSADAFTNNLHELVYHIRCSDGLELHVTILAAIGTPGGFTRSCDGTDISVGIALPLNSPQGGGRRLIPDRTCVVKEILVASGVQSDYGALHESWQTSNSIRTADGRELAFFNPYFQVFLPSRYYNPAVAGVVGRPMDMCYEQDSGGLAARGGPCAQATSNGLLTGITYDDPRSPFNGVERVVDINDTEVRNADGPTVWFTDPFGGNAQTDSFPGAIRQLIAKIDNHRNGLSNGGPELGRNRNYGAPSVHSPN
ncbi:MAG TPA: hypothetical protein VEH62_03255 [Gemmatimonadales bacterium]|nr:hypothetical protein [Gemmatimonadales bacterium]